MTNPKIGDKVQFSDSFIESIRADYDTCQLRGVIIDLPVNRNSTIPRRVRVRWDDDTESSSLIKNLQRIR